MPIETHQIRITLPDGISRQVSAGCTAGEALRKDSGALVHDVLAVKVNGVLRDLSAILTEDASLEPVTFASPDGKDVYRHSSTHIMAQAVKAVFPSAQLAIGPAIEEGFYYDFAFDRPFTPEDPAGVRDALPEPGTVGCKSGQAGRDQATGRPQAGEGAGPDHDPG